MKPLKIFTYFLLFLSPHIYAQEPKYINYNTDHGLPSNEVYHVMQDSKGFIWLGTDNGVSRFNGYKFENYGIEDGLINKNVHAIYEDYMGRIWFVHSNNKLTYFFNDTIFQYKYNQILPQNPYIERSNRFGNIYIDNISIDSSDNLLVNYTQGSIIIKNNGIIEHILFERDTNIYFELSYDSSFANNITRSNDFDTLTPINKELKVLRYEGKLFNIILRPKRTIPKVNLKIVNEKHIFSNGESIFDFSNSKLISLNSPNKGGVITMEQDGKDLWVSYHIDLGARCYKNANIQNPPLKHFVRDKTVTMICRDKENGLWFSTLEDGIYYIANEEILSFNNGIIGEVYAASNFAIKDHKLYFLNDNNHGQLLEKGKLKPFLKSQNLFDSHIASIGDNIWVFSRDAIYKLDKNNGLQIINRKKNIYLDKYTSSGIAVTTVHQISKSIFMLGNASGMSVINLDFNDNPTYSAFFFPKLLKNKINDFESFKDTVVLAATHKGLYLIIPDTNNIIDSKIKCLNYKNKEFETRIDIIVYCDHNKMYWMATKNKGIMVWNPQNDSVYKVSKQNGLADNSVTALFCKDSIIWAATRFGLNKVVIKDTANFSYEICTYTKKHGLLSNQINDIAVIDSTVYVGTNKGLCFFNYHVIEKNEVPPPVYISKLKINEEDTTVRKTYVLNYLQNNISIQFVGIAYKAQKDILYKFRLSGSDTSWSYTKNTEVRFPQLPSGSYNFEVYAQNEDRVWSNEPATISFEIRPPYWKTWWFRSIIVLVFLSFIWILFLLRMKEIKKRNLLRLEEERKRNKIEKEAEKKRIELEQNLSQTQQKLVTQQLNPHFLFNTMTSIQSMIFKNQKMEAVNLLSRFARLMRQGLEYSRIEYATISECIEFFKNYIALKSINLEENIDVRIVIDEQVNAEDTLVPPMMIQPFIENAIIHGLSPKGKDMILSIKFFTKGGKIECIVEDNGIGMQESQKLKSSKDIHHKSFGVKIINETLDLMNKLHNEDFSIRYEELEKQNIGSFGTRMLITFPIKK